MDPIEQLKWLIDKDGGGVMLITIAKYCNYTPAYLSNILKQKYSPSDKMLTAIRIGLREYFNEIKNKIGETL